MNFGGIIHDFPKQWLIAGALFATTTSTTVPVRMEGSNTTAYSINDVTGSVDRIAAASELVDVALSVAPGKRHMVEWERKLTSDFLLSLSS